MSKKMVSLLLLFAFIFSVNSFSITKRQRDRELLILLDKGSKSFENCEEEFLSTEYSSQIVNFTNNDWTIDNTFYEAEATLVLDELN